METFFQMPVEFEHFGWNLLFITFAISIILAFFERYFVIEQAQEVKDKQSTQSLSVPWFIYSFWFFLSFMVYGFFQRSLLIIIDGGFGVAAYWVLLRNVYRVQKFSRREWFIHAAYGLMVPAILLNFDSGISHDWQYAGLFFEYGGTRGVLITVFMFVSLKEMVDIPLSLKDEKDTGVVLIGLLMVSFINLVSWFLYGIATQDWPLIIYCPF